MKQSTPLRELTDLCELQTIQDDFAEVAGMSSVVVSPDGEPFTRFSNPTAFCRLIQSTEKGRRRCFESFMKMSQEALIADEPGIRYCFVQGGHYVAPIIINGKHLATMNAGQFIPRRFSPKQLKSLERIALKIDLDPEILVEAAKKMRVLKEDDVRQISRLLFSVTKVVTKLATQATELKQAEQQIKDYAATLESKNLALEELNEAAKAANWAKSEFLANMSHEIRTPMTAILGFSEVLTESALDKEQLDAAKTIKQNGEYLIGIINDILDLSKIEAGKLEIENVQCSPCQILSDVASLMRVRANTKNLSLQIDYDGPMPRTIQSDPTRLRQILINLIGNAIKFTEVGKVRLVARLLDAECDEPKMQFEVVDSGIGMTEEQIARLFNPFQQADTSTTRKFGGTGLGLTICKRLADKLGGDISAKSTASEGSTFTVTVGTGPLDGVKLLDGTSEAQFPTHSDRKPAAVKIKLDCRVLLAEDGPDNQRLIVFLLKKAGAEVVVADNGRIAYDLALAARDEGAPFDVILMDMQMPVMGGYEATAKLREAGYTGPIIALTAHAMSTDRDKCLNAGCNDYTTKPIDHKKLISVVAEYASGQGLHKSGDIPVV